MPGYAFLARQVLTSKRLLLCGATSEVLDDLICALTLVSQGLGLPLQLFYFREVQPMYDFHFQRAREIEASPNPCVVLCDYDVLTHRQYIRLLIDPKCTIIVLTSLPLVNVPPLYKNSCICVVECFQRSCFYGNFTDRVFCHLTLTFALTPSKFLSVVTGLQQQFRRRMAKLIVLQRFVKGWLYRPSARFAVALVRRCHQQACVVQGTK